MAKQLDWSILVDHGNTILPQKAHTYDLFNVSVQKCLTFGVRLDGICLTWGNPAKSDSIRFVSASGKKDPITFGELIAINVRSASYLVYQSDSNGINLGWSETPKFEWKVMGGPAGSRVEPGMVVGLYSTVEKDFLMYESRGTGINLKWFKDSGKYNGVLSDLADAVPSPVRIFKKVAGAAVSYATSGVISRDAAEKGIGKLVGG